MAYSSLMEVLNQLIFALDQSWIKGEDYEDLRNEISKLSYMINSLRKSLNL
jgi:four helix bundle protein